MVKNNFVIDYLLGNCEISDVERYIGRWNNGDKEQSLYAYLGLTNEDMHGYMYGASLKKLLADYWIPKEIEAPHKTLLVFREEGDLEMFVGTFDRIKQLFVSEEKELMIDNVNSYKLLR